MLPVNVGEVIGIRHRDEKARYAVSWVSDEDTQQTRSIGVDCLEDKNFFDVRRVASVQSISTAAAYARENGNVPKAGVPGLPQMPNRREAERFNCRVAADVAMMNGVSQAYAWVIDISEKGCYLQMVSPFAVGIEIAVSIHAVDLKKESPLTMRAIVRTSHPMVGMGIEFLAVTAEDKRRIQIVLEQLGGPKPAGEQDSAAWTPTALPPVTVPQSTLSVQPAAVQVPTFSLTPPNATKPDIRALALRICMDIQKLEAMTVPSAYDVKLKDELRKAAVHMRSAWHLYGVEKN